LREGDVIVLAGSRNAVSDAVDYLAQEDWRQVPRQSAQEVS
jgi:hypothetical protein